MSRRYAYTFVGRWYLRVIHKIMFGCTSTAELRQPKAVQYCYLLLSLHRYDVVPPRLAIASVRSLCFHVLRVWFASDRSLIRGSSRSHCALLARSINKSVSANQVTQRTATAQTSGQHKTCHRFRQFAAQKEFSEIRMKRVRFVDCTRPREPRKY